MQRVSQDKPVHFPQHRTVSRKAILTQDVCVGGKISSQISGTIVAQKKKKKTTSKNLFLTLNREELGQRGNCASARLWPKAHPSHAKLSWYLWSLYQAPGQQTITSNKTLSTSKACAKLYSSASFSPAVHKHLSWAAHGLAPSPLGRTLLLGDYIQKRQLHQAGCWEEGSSCHVPPLHLQRHGETKEDIISSCCRCGRVGQRREITSW